MVTIDIFTEMLKIQKAYQNKYDYHPMLHEVVTALSSECMEVWAKTGGKWWKKKETWTMETRDDLVDEVADMLHFFLLACIVLDIEPQELWEAYKKKMGINIARQENGY